MSNFLMTKTTEKEIGLQAILQWLRVHTPYGKKAKDRMEPFLPGEIEGLEMELKQVELLGNLMEQEPVLIKALKSSFNAIKDIEGSMNRARADEILNEIELFEIKCQVMEMNHLSKNLHYYLKGQLQNLQLEELLELEQLLDPEGYGIKSFYLYDCYSHELAGLRREKQSTERLIQEESQFLYQSIFQSTGIKPKANGEIHLSKTEVEKIKSLTECRQLYVASEGLQSIFFKIIPTVRLNQLNEALESLGILEEEEELKVRKELSLKIKKHSEPLIGNIEKIGRLDLLLGKVILGKKIKGCRPQILREGTLRIKMGRHPIVEEALAARGLKYSPIDMVVKEGATLITGANMGGKTVTLKLVALITAMAQLGLFVPAEVCALGIVEYIHFSTGDHQSVESGLSTFGAEMKALTHALGESNRRGLILIDELARGTNPQEGFAITHAVIEFLKEKPAITIMTTHHEGLSQITSIEHLQVIGLRDVTLEELKNAFQTEGHHGRVLEKYMDFRLEPMSKPQGVPMEALKIAELMGVKEEIIQRAEEILTARLLHKNSSNQ